MFHWPKKGERIVQGRRKDLCMGGENCEKAEEIVRKTIPFTKVLISMEK